RDDLAKAKAGIADATETADALRRSVHELLAAELLASGADPMLVVHARSIAPRWFERDASLAEAQRRLRRARNVRGLFRAFRRRMREQAVVSHAGGLVHDMEELEHALHMANASRQSLELETSGGLDLTSVWPRLIEAEENRRIQHGRWLNASAHAESRVTSQARSTMALVASALRAGRSARREKLGRIHGERIADALPLWIGTLRDVDDLLPRTPAMFDLVIVDEASQVDQISGAPALLRAGRAVVVGDPRQLRHVSFLSDAAIGEAIAAQGIADATDVGLLDVRRLSLFDLAAAAAPTIMLAEHFRSAPHLIGFSARHFYGGAVSIATTHPRNHDRDCISVDAVPGTRDDKGVNVAEIDHAIAIVRERLEAGRASGEPARIGIVSPFRAQADAIEQRIVDEFTLDEIDELALRVGTVHGFQGCERDLVIISLALTADSSPSARGFLADPNLFNVMVSRAREEIVLVTSLPADTSGIVGDYMRYGSSPPSVPAARGRPTTTVEWIAGELARGGVKPLANYPAGRHTLDLVFGEHDEAIGVTFGVHPEGPDAHIERRIALHRAGWEITEAFDTRWGERRTELAVELILEAQRRVPS
ncbi:MAG TPA: DEAD/DEAH box helicase, partial [Ilumatobacter sp.]